MKAKITTLVLALFAGTMVMNAQMSKEECTTTLSLFSEAAKVKNYTAARPHYDKLMANCPDISLALYQLGERMLKADMKASADKKAGAQAIIDLYKKRTQYFASKTPAGSYGAKSGQLMYDNDMGTKKAQFDVFDAAWKADRRTFVNPKSIYTYFSLAVDLYNAGQYDLQDVFDLYDDTQSKITEENNKLAKKLAPILDKEEKGEALTSKEKKELKKEKNLEAYSKVAGSIDSKLGQLADCPNLIPLYQKDFDTKKNDIEWIKKAAGRLSGKDCTDSQLFLDLVKELDRMDPSADTKFYLYKLEKQKGNEAQATTYLKQSIDLQTDPIKKAKAHYTIAEQLKKSGSYGQARTNYMKALEYNPSLGVAYLRIAAMYASSANNCGNDTFEKRAVYWLAAETARRAGRVDPRLSGTASQTAASYNAKAPDKTMIFTRGAQGQTISIGCWIGRSVRVPNL